MELKLLRETTIKELKKQFNKYFPFLKLEAYFQFHGRKEGSASYKKIEDSVQLNEIKSLVKEGVFSFTGSMVVADFEQTLQGEFGLSVQLFRKAGSLWIQTMGTDNLSLQKQNEMGLATSRQERYNLHSLFL